MEEDAASKKRAASDISETAETEENLQTKKSRSDYASDTTEQAAHPHEEDSSGSNDETKRSAPPQLPDEPNRSTENNRRYDDDGDNAPDAGGATVAGQTTTPKPAQTQTNEATATSTTEAQGDNLESTQTTANASANLQVGQSDRDSQTIGGGREHDDDTSDNDQAERRTLDPIRELDEDEHSEMQSLAPSSSGSEEQSNDGRITRETLESGDDAHADDEQSLESRQTAEIVNVATVSRTEQQEVEAPDASGNNDNSSDSSARDDTVTAGQKRSAEQISAAGDEATESGDEDEQPDRKRARLEPSSTASNIADDADDERSTGSDMSDHSDAPAAEARSPSPRNDRDGEEVSDGDDSISEDSIQSRATRQRLEVEAAQQEAREELDGGNRETGVRTRGMRAEEVNGADDNASTSSSSDDDDDDDDESSTSSESTRESSRDEERSSAGSTDRSDLSSVESDGETQSSEASFQSRATRQRLEVEAAQQEAREELDGGNRETGVRTRGMRAEEVNGADDNASTSSSSDDDDNNSTSSESTRRSTRDDDSSSHDSSDGSDRGGLDADDRSQASDDNVNARTSERTDGRTQEEGHNQGSQAGSAAPGNSAAAASEAGTDREDNRQDYQKAADEMLARVERAQELRNQTAQTESAAATNGNSPSPDEIRARAQQLLYRADMRPAVTPNSASVSDDNRSTAASPPQATELNERSPQGRNASPAQLRATDPFNDPAFAAAAIRAADASERQYQQQQKRAAPVEENDLATTSEGQGPAKKPRVEGVENGQTNTAMAVETDVDRPPQPERLRGNVSKEQTNQWVVDHAAADPDRYRDVNTENKRHSAGSFNDVERIFRAENPEVTTKHLFITRDTLDEVSEIVRRDASRGEVSNAQENNTQDNNALPPATTQAAAYDPSLSNNRGREDRGTSL